MKKKTEKQADPPLSLHVWFQEAMVRTVSSMLHNLHRLVSDITAAMSIFYIQFLVLFLDTGTHRHQHHECEDWNSLTAS